MYTLHSHYILFLATVFVLRATCHIEFQKPKFSQSIIARKTWPPLYICNATGFVSL